MSAQETALSNEIKALANTLEERRAQSRAASNAIVRSRFEQQVLKMQEQLAAKQKLLSDITGKMEAIKNAC